MLLPYYYCGFDTNTFIYSKREYIVSECRLKLSTHIENR